MDGQRTSCCGTMEHVSATKMTLNTLTFKEQEGHEALNRSPEYTGQKSNI